MFKTIPLLEKSKRIYLAKAVVRRAKAIQDKINRLKGKDNSRDKQLDNYRSNARKKCVDAIRASKTYTNFIAYKYD